MKITRGDATARRRVTEQSLNGIPSSSRFAQESREAVSERVPWSMTDRNANGMKELRKLSSIIAAPHTIAMLQRDWEDQI